MGQVSKKEIIRRKFQDEIASVRDSRFIECCKITSADILINVKSRNFNIIKYPF